MSEHGLVAVETDNDGGFVLASRADLAAFVSNKLSSNDNCISERCTLSV